ncbi:MAG: hypothetical protein P8M61_00065 [Crocinitomicaceae bacterium]|nr:hypothetical protein [Crocinitomicaceae bacterium]MDG2463456.1 hypothetical protein [Crocinitomicaceae bacterium]
MRLINSSPNRNFIKLLLLIGSLFFIQFISFGQTGSCSEKFKTGKFKYVGLDSDAIVIRTEKKQYESWDGRRSKIIMKIKWIGPETYTLKVVKVINVEGGLNKGDIITATITDCTDKQFTFIYSAAGAQGESKMRKIN